MVFSCIEFFYFFIIVSSFMISMFAVFGNQLFSVFFFTYYSYTKSMFFVFGSHYSSVIAVFGGVSVSIITRLSKLGLDSSNSRAFSSTDATKLFNYPVPLIFSAGIWVSVALPASVILEFFVIFITYSDASVPLSPSNRLSNALFPTSVARPTSFSSAAGSL